MSIFKVTSFHFRFVFSCVLSINEYECYQFWPFNELTIVGQASSDVFLTLYRSNFNTCFDMLLQSKQIV